ncbi:MAG: nucleoside triphosphate pyrophosphohydrolase [Bryobacterales bacterium]|nr:nucleoside triphosphate pyrophosphohydrolase [Bryobacterales bacterium]
MPAGEKFDRLVAIMARLRAPDGCPWDREQTLETIKPYLLEETYEVLDAIDARDWRGLAEELGDLMLQAVFFARIAGDEGLFTIEESLDAINTKLVRRHPHVFADGDARTADEVKQRWDRIKAEEHREKGGVRERLLDGISRSQPALAEAAQIAGRAAKAGFDWENAEQVIAKLHEELDELAAARASGIASHQAGEIGDLLFVIVNIARFLKVDPEQALRRTNRKFRRRFGYVEEKLDQAGKRLEESSIDEMEALWQEAKRLE